MTDLRSNTDLMAREFEEAKEAEEASLRTYWQELPNEQRTRILQDAYQALDKYREVAKVIDPRIFLEHEIWQPGLRFTALDKHRMKINGALDRVNIAYMKAQLRHDDYDRSLVQRCIPQPELQIFAEALVQAAMELDEHKRKIRRYHTPGDLSRPSNVALLFALADMHELDACLELDANKLGDEAGRMCRLHIKYTNAIRHGDHDEWEAACATVAKGDDDGVRGNASNANDFGEVKSIGPWSGEESHNTPVHWEAPPSYDNFIGLGHRLGEVMPRAQTRGRATHRSDPVSADRRRRASKPRHERPADQPRSAAGILNQERTDSFRRDREDEKMLRDARMRQETARAAEKDASIKEQLKDRLQRFKDNEPRLQEQETATSKSTQPFQTITETAIVTAANTEEPSPVEESMPGRSVHGRDSDRPNL